MPSTPPPPSAVPVATLLAELRSTPEGLTASEAGRRLALDSSGRPPRSSGVARTVLRLLGGQFRSPILWMLLAAATISAVLGDAADTAIILLIIVASSLLGFWQEWGAARAVEKLLALVSVHATALRDGRPTEVPVEALVPGDVVLLNAGDLVPGDGRLLDSRNLFVNEAALTGETFPVEKSSGVAAPGPGGDRGGSLFLGTNVVSGTGRLLIVGTGAATEFGKISARLRQAPPTTEFELGLRRFGGLLLEVTLVLVLAIFAINVYLHRPVLESLLFALAIAVGLTPQLLPAILSMNLAHAARRMAARQVIVRQLSAIENLGSMDVLCSDKTGTLTEGTVRLHGALDLDGQPSERVALCASLNATFQLGYTNPVDGAIVAAHPIDASRYTRLDEEPYDFVRKRLSVLIREGDRHQIVTKGALDPVLAVCTTARTAAGALVDLASVRNEIDRLATGFGAQGYRLLGVASREVGPRTGMERDDESGMTLEGLLVLDDPLRPGIVATVAGLAALGIAIKVITGDSRLVAGHIAALAGLDATTILTGSDLHAMSEEALVRRAPQVAVFAEIEPNQKERILRALKTAGHVVGYLGDGINDAPALHAADVGISVADAVDVAREAAAIVLLEKDLAVLAEGVQEGRQTFANTQKYVFMATSANFGNMVSMAVASVFLPFLPLLPKQVLLTNLLTDLPEMTIATDQVDPEMVESPRRWDIGFIRRFMTGFGALSSAFDLLTFAVLAWWLRAEPAEFRTGWFVESVVSAALIVLVVRTRRPFSRSRPSRPLAAATALVVAGTLLLPYSPLAAPLGFVPLPAGVLAALLGIVGLYVGAAEAIKRRLYRPATDPGRDAAEPELQLP